MIKHLYIHIPFCDSVCPYCDFTKRVSNNETQKIYLNQLLKEIEYNKDSFNDLETIFIGGGTPTSFIYLKELLEALNTYIDLNSIKEFTIETTPARALDYLSLYKKYNINRISIGVESFDPRVNKYLKRKSNDYESVKEVVNTLKINGITNINLDLIYSLPFQSLDLIKKDIKIIKELDATHVSYYDLIIEDKTILKYDLDHKKISLPSEDESVKMRDYINDKLDELGYKRYEISNYAKSGFESIHNMSYWTLEDYLGLGLNAHSKVGNKRFFNTNSLKTYALFNSKAEYEAEREIEECDLKVEYNILGLRTIKGVSLNIYKVLFKNDLLVDYPFVQDFINNGLLEIDGDYLRLTKKGLDLGNIVFSKFL